MVSELVTPILNWFGAAGVESKWRKRREGLWAQAKRRNMQKPTASHLHFSELFTK